MQANHLIHQSGKSDDLEQARNAQISNTAAARLFPHYFRSGSLNFWQLLPELSTRLYFSDLYTAQPLRGCFIYYIVAH